MTHDANQFEDAGDLSPAERLEQLRERIRTEGAEAGYKALLSVCNDVKAPAPAKATAGSALMRAAGLLEKQEGGPEKQPHEMSATELDREMKRLEAALKAAKAGGEDEPMFE
ncbi:hypothetical protein M2322_002775 [Rhodoblastus acidophilus]|uniref:hypothetical protein n=1 Tax=Rhodoblastus acidophilus TaxID=1074 RepID=UPI00222456CA|nr:hypothetical protein [Rhodoblastus acidophilus]MCW2317221.1 hypothetical protein [Rhodoblastus acidophilus]